MKKASWDHTRDLIRVGLARTFKLDRVDEPYEECKRRGVSPGDMRRVALETDIYGRDRRQLRLDFKP